VADSSASRIRAFMFLPFSMPPVGRWDRPTGTAQVPRSTPLRPLCSQPGWERPGPGPASGSANALLPGWLSLGTSASLGMPAHLQSRWAGSTGRLGGGGYDAGVRLVSGEEAGHADWVVGPESNPGRCSRLAVALASAFRDDPVIAWVFPTSYAAVVSCPPSWSSACVGWPSRTTRYG
jgi:hypothetical protein